VTSNVFNINAKWMPILTLQKNNHSNHDLKLSDIEFVSAHIRRVGYEHHMKVTYKNATIVDQKFYLNAFKWLQKQVNKTLIMIVVTDDMKWAQDNLAKGRDDIFMPG
jgi:Glycosyl transferase family 11